MDNDQGKDRMRSDTQKKKKKPLSGASVGTSTSLVWYLELEHGHCNG